MSTKPPTPRAVLALCLFALSCFGLTLFLWATFGGPGPLKPKSYRMSVPFKDATQLAPEADVRISGVNVGKVKTKTVDEDGDVTVAVVEIDPDFAPRPADSRAILRQKTLLGEAYIELTPGSPKAPKLEDGGSLPKAAVSPTVALDDVLRTFDPTTRKALATWFTEQGTALQNGGPELNAALAQLAPLGEYGGDVLRIVRRQDRATAALVRDGGVALTALTERQGQLRNLVSNADRVFSTTAARNEALASAVEILPTFLAETRATSGRVSTFAVTTKPLLDALRPAARELSPTLRDLRSLAPDLATLLRALRPLAVAARPAVPAVDNAFTESEPLLATFRPYLGRLIPSITYLGRYQREIASFLGNLAAVTQPTLPAADGSGPLHYGRGSLPINPETLAPYPKRLSTTRGNAYPQAGSYMELPEGLSVFGDYLCANSGGALPTLSDSIDPLLRVDIQGAYFPADGAGPPCKSQEPLGTTMTGTPSSFPKLEPLP